MSNVLAVATVTAGLQLVLQGPADEVVPGAVVTTDRPDSRQQVPPTPGINVFLYHVQPNPSLRNTDLPTRAPDGGRVLRRAQAALDLAYLLTFHGDEAELQPHRLLGAAVRTLHERPVLARDVLTAVVAAASADPPTHGFLSGSDLAEQPERVTLTPIPLDLEDISHLWTMFAQTPFVLSVAYRASAVLIDGLDEPLPVLPVRTPKLVVRTGVDPRAAGRDPS
jgi:hypothetical protein